MWNTSRTLARRYYEMSDHLGNVLATVLDRKTGAGTASGGSLYDHWSADLASTADYYPGGMMMPGRNTEYSWSRMGYNGQAKDDEVYGKGNLNSALFWEMDTRILRRWNVDPVNQISLSCYAILSGNPITQADPNGDCDKCKKGNIGMESGRGDAENPEPIKEVAIGSKGKPVLPNKDLAFNGKPYNPLGNLIKTGQFIKPMLNVVGNEVEGMIAPVTYKDHKDGFLPLGPLNGLTVPILRDKMTEVDKFSYNIAVQRGFTEFIKVAPMLKTISFVGIYVTLDEAQKMAQGGIKLKDYENRIQPIGPNRPYGDQYQYLIYFPNGTQYSNYNVVDQIKGNKYIPKEKIELEEFGMLKVE